MQCAFCTTNEATSRRYVRGEWHASCGPACAKPNVVPQQVGPERSQKFESFLEQAKQELHKLRSERRAVMVQFAAEDYGSDTANKLEKEIESLSESIKQAEVLVANMEAKVAAGKDDQPEDQPAAKRVTRDDVADSAGQKAEVSDDAKKRAEADAKKRAKAEKRIGELNNKIRDAQLAELKKRLDGERKHVDTELAKAIAHHDAILAAARKARDEAVAKFNAEAQSIKQKMETEAEEGRKKIAAGDEMVITPEIQKLLDKRKRLLSKIDGSDISPATPLSSSSSSSSSSASLPKPSSSSSGAAPNPFTPPSSSAAVSKSSLSSSSSVSVPKSSSSSSSAAPKPSSAPVPKPSSSSSSSSSASAPNPSAAEGYSATVQKGQITYKLRKFDPVPADFELQDLSLGIRSGERATSLTSKPQRAVLADLIANIDKFQALHVPSGAGKHWVATFENMAKVLSGRDAATANKLAGLWATYILAKADHKGTEPPSFVLDGAKWQEMFYKDNSSGAELLVVAPLENKPEFFGDIKAMLFAYARLSPTDMVPVKQAAAPPAKSAKDKAVTSTTPVQPTVNPAKPAAALYDTDVDLM